MNRDLKFRAWDNGAKCWLLGYEYPNLGGFSLFGETVMFGEWASILDTFLFERENKEGRKFKADDLKVMQYTGLKDKNNQEVYEGDIVKFPSKLNNFYSIHQSNTQQPVKPYIVADVAYQEGCFTFDWQYGYEGKEVDFEQVEVIGNIYENPELLNV